MYDLAMQLNAARNELLWLCLVGLTESCESGRLDPDFTVALTRTFQAEVNRLNSQGPRGRRTTEDGAEVSIGILFIPLKWYTPSALSYSVFPIVIIPIMIIVSSGRIAISKELRFMMLRHWPLYDAIFHSRYASARLGVWNKSGRLLFKKCA